MEVDRLPGSWVDCVVLESEWAVVAGEAEGVTFLRFFFDFFNAGTWLAVPLPSVFGVGVPSCLWMAFFFFVGVVRSVSTRSLEDELRELFFGPSETC